VELVDDGHAWPTPTPDKGCGHSDPQPSRADCLMGNGGIGHAPSWLAQRKNEADSAKVNGQK